MIVEKEFFYNPVNSWSKTNPYTMAFVYPKDGEPYIVKGGYIEVTGYLEKEDRPAIVHYVLWHHKLHRSIITTINCGKVAISRKHKLWEVSVAMGVGFTTYKVIATMKKLPRKWIKELDDYILVKSNKNNWRKIVL